MRLQIIPFLRRITDEYWDGLGVPKEARFKNSIHSTSAVKNVPEVLAARLRRSDLWGLNYDFDSHWGKNTSYVSALDYLLKFLR